jgi:hypothetical protein
LEYTLGLENWMTKKYYPELFKGLFEYGWGNGYVLLPHNHPFYGQDYNDLEVPRFINIHGGLTFSDYFSNTRFLEWIENREIFGNVNKDNFEKFDRYWMIGFDTNHSGDNRENCSKEFVMKEIDKLLEQCLDDSIEGMKMYKNFYLRKDKLKHLNSLMP